MSHYYDEKPQAEHKTAEIQIRFSGQDFAFVTDSGVFSRLRLDFGSELLIETVKSDLRPYGRLLDLGCGYGPVGIIMKRLFPALEVVLCDINERAVQLARGNARLNKTQFIDIIQSDGLAAVPGDFDLILTNPPIRAGKAVVFRFFTEASAALRPGGRLYVVIQKKQGAPSAVAKLRDLFRSVDIIEHKAGYWIIRSADPMRKV